MQTQIINLAELGGDDDFPTYAAICCRPGDNPYVLSPNVMRWSDNMLLTRLDDCRLFWLNQKKKLRCKLIDLFDPLLSHHYGDSYLAVFASHPWQCLLYLHYQLSHQGQGIYFLQSRLDQNIYKSLDWDCWFAAQLALPEHLAAINARSFNPESLRARQAQMQRFIQRIGVSCPNEMRTADANSITRRFGSWLGRVWQWSFSDSTTLERFPWIKLDPDKPPRVSRELEYPVNQWAYVEVLLREDLTLLCTQMQQDECQHINRMVWEIMLFNYQKITVELSFRHPYSLHRDMPDFDTALYQARYIYEDLAQKLAQREHDLDLPESMPFIGWRIEVCERILLAPMLWDLFAREFDQIDYQQIMALQNKLPLAFESYQPNTSFYPELSFQASPIGAADSLAYDLLQWSGSASDKPLFYYSQARPIDPPSRMQKIFLERNSEQWWLGEDLLQTIRDYFLLKDSKGRCSWAYRNRQGEWFKHGEYC